jgi:hypothetical protein
MSHTVEVLLYFNVARTIRSSIELVEICETDTDGIAVSTPHALRTESRTLIARRVIEDILYDHPDLLALTDVLLVQDKFRILRHGGTGEQENCNHQSAYKQRLAAYVAANKTLCVALHLHNGFMASLRLDPRANLHVPSRLFPQATATAGTAPPMSLTPPAPKKLDINDTLELKFFNAKDIQSLTKIVDIQRWYNGLHSKGRVCCIYTSPWESFIKYNYMGDTWSPSTITQTVYDRCDLMPAVIHSLLSSTGIFKGEFEEFGQMVSNSEGNGYLALYQIIRLFHPVVGQTATQPPQPQQKKAQPFAEHIINYLEYFQSELCSSRTYSTNERVILILSRLHPTWRDAIKRKYTTLVPQNGAIPPIPMECQLAMMSVTLTQWCVEERLEFPSAKVMGPSSSVLLFMVTLIRVDDAVATFADLQLDPIPDSICFWSHQHRHRYGGSCHPTHSVLRQPRFSKGSYLKCSACGLPGHTLDKCHPLVNFCLAHALVAQHPDIDKRIKAAYAQFPRSNSSRPPRVSSVKKLVSLLDLLPEDPPSDPGTKDLLHTSHHIYLIDTLDLSAAGVSHGHTGLAIISFRNRSWFPSSQETPAHAFQVVSSRAPSA